MSKKTIAVVGATGSQGGGLVRAIQSDPSGQFTARALTRDPNSAKAQQLAALGAEVVKANVDDPASIRAALEGAYGAYFVTFFWDHHSPEKELKEAESYAQSAKDAGVQHAVWSTLEDIRKWYPLEDTRMPTLAGHYKVPHFDAKGEANRFFTEAGVPTTFAMASFYWDNFVGFGSGPKRDESGKLVLSLPMGDSKMAGIATEDIGRCAYGVFIRPDLIGQTVGFAGEHLTGAEMAAQMGEALGEEVRYQPVPFDVFRGLGFPGAEELGNMFQFYAEQEEYFKTGRDVELSHSLNPQLQSFLQWLTKNAKSIPI